MRSSRSSSGCSGSTSAPSDTLLRMLQRRETLGSTGVGRGIAIPHCRSLVVSRLRLAYGHHADGRRVPGHRQPPGLRFLSDRGPAARGLQPVPPGAGEDRAVRQGARHSRPARRASVGGRLPAAAGREGSVGRALVVPDPAGPGLASRPLAGQTASDRAALDRFRDSLAAVQRHLRARPPPAALAGRRPQDPVSSLRFALVALRRAELGADADAGDARDVLRRLTKREPALAARPGTRSPRRRSAARRGSARTPLALGNRVGTGTLERAHRVRAPRARGRPALRASRAHPRRRWRSACATPRSTSRRGTRSAAPTAAHAGPAGRAPAGARPARACRGRARVGARCRSSTAADADAAPPRAVARLELGAHEPGPRVEARAIAPYFEGAAER